MTLAASWAVEPLQMLLLGAALEYASERLRNRRDVVLAAVTTDGESLKFASKAMQANHEAEYANMQQMSTNTVVTEIIASNFPTFRCCY
eukprot:1430413-Amphidinium_carterae.1